MNYVDVVRHRRRRRRALAALVLAATVASAGSAWANAPVAPSPGSTWTDQGPGTVTTGIPLPHHH
ncbi:MAG TPA: hypothetical protein VE081_12885 [Sporichthyaceae bacterium]|jgi:hypothetical protein|nr:hypothetical protein [Sporichthyaceae bacterium]